MNEIVVDYEKVIDAIRAEIKATWEGIISTGDPSILNIIKEIKSIEVSDEQLFRKQESERKLRRGTVYLVVRFNSGSINYGSSVVPISITGLGVANQVKPVQYLLSVFASSWTTLELGKSTDFNIENAIQVWNTPEVISNFNAVDADFRNLYRTTGNIVFGSKDYAVRVGTLTYYYGDGENDNEEVSIMSFGDGYRASLDSQPFGNTFSFAKSEVNFTTYTFSVSTYLLNNQLSADVLAIRGFRNRYGGSGSITSTKEPNDDFKIEITLSNGFSNLPANGETASVDDPVLGSDFFGTFKVVDSQIRQDIAGIPTLTITFSR